MRSSHSGTGHRLPVRVWKINSTGSTFCSLERSARRASQTVPDSRPSAAHGADTGSARRPHKVQWRFHPQYIPWSVHLLPTHHTVRVPRENRASCSAGQADLLVRFWGKFGPYYGFGPNCVSRQPSSESSSRPRGPARPLAPGADSPDIRVGSWPLAAGRTRIRARCPSPGPGQHLMR
jgi:hypothetical protein